MSGNCKGCTGSHGTGSCGCGKAGPLPSDPCDPIPDDLIVRAPYDTLYVRCRCGGCGLSAALWDEFGPHILRSDGLHVDSRRAAPGEVCRDALSLQYPADEALVKQLGGRWP